MRKEFLMAAITAAIVIGRGAKAAELPRFELASFPITRHQVAVMGAVDVREQSPAPTLMYRGMPASPHQIAVLTTRSGVAGEAMLAKLTTVGFAWKEMRTCPASNVGQ
jgi:hypothetical protein